MTVSGFPHSEISGSLSTYDSPKRIAVCCVLHQLSMPRHSPYALIRFINFGVCNREELYLLFFNLFDEITSTRRKNLIYQFFSIVCYSVFKERIQSSISGNRIRIN